MKVKDKQKSGRKVNPGWERLTKESRIGTRLVKDELAAALNITRSSVLNYYDGKAILPKGWAVVKIGGTVFIERVKG